MRILFSADWHINLHKKKIPYDWQYSRFQLMFDKMLELEKIHDIIIIGGDLFDRSPHSDEIALLLSYLNRTKKPVRIIPGNHESTAKGKSFLEHFERDWVLLNSNVKVYTTNKRENIEGVDFQFFPYNEMELDNLPEAYPTDILITHIRGDAPPHVKAEYNFDYINRWKLTLLGDLHFHHQYNDMNIWYPGSPINTTFDRNSDRKYGLISVDYNSIQDYKINFIDLKLPKLIRKTVTSDKDIIQSDFDHIVYEVKGNMKDLSLIGDNVLLDKKIVERAKESSKINMIGLTIEQELSKWLDHNMIADKQAIQDEFKSI